MSNEIAEILPLADEDVCRYLEQNPQFFERNSELLDRLEVQHQVHGSVSLVERQILGLREREKSLSQKLDNLLHHAQLNNDLLEKSIQLTLRIIGAQSSQEVVDSVRHELTHHFEIDDCQVWLFDEAGTLHHVNYGDREMIQQLTEHLFTDKTPMCGRVTEAISQLFGGEESIASYALMPLGEQANEGVIVLGSKSAEFFTADMGTLFLSLIADVTHACLIHQTD